MSRTNKIHKTSKAVKPKTSMFRFVVGLPWLFHLAICLALLSVPHFFYEYLVLFSHKIRILNISMENLVYIVYGLSGLFFLFTICSFFKRKQDDELWKRRLTLQELNRMDWEQLEHLVKILFIKIGYKIIQRGGARADGGVDLEARKFGRKVIVQCKQWKSNKVGVTVVREMFAVMIHEKAKKVYIVTCGSFTKDAEEFAKGKPVYLIDGSELVSWVNKVKKK